MRSTRRLVPQNSAAQGGRLVGWERRRLAYLVTLILILLLLLLWIITSFRSSNARRRNSSSPSSSQSPHASVASSLDHRKLQQDGFMNFIAAARQPSGTLLKRTVADMRCSFFVAPPPGGDTRLLVQSDEDQQFIAETLSECLKTFPTPASVTVASVVPHVDDVVIQLKAQAGEAPIMIHSWKNFFGTSVLRSWIPRLLKSWDDGVWLTATNNDGKRFGAKFVSHEGAAERRALARSAYERSIQNGGDDASFFGYVKRELPRDHQLHKEIREFLDSVEMRTAIANVMFDSRVVGWTRFVSETQIKTAKLRRDALRAARDAFISKATLGDFFVSLFAPDGDFLTSHNDGSLGSIAAVGHFAVRRHLGGRTVVNATLSASNRSDGALSFFCADRGTFCVDIPAAADELLVFPTRPHLASHRVSMNSDPELLRFSFTGWFAMPGEDQMLKY